MDDPEWINERVAYWDNVYGFDMSCMKHFMDDQVIVDYASSGCLASTIATVQTIDCNRVRVAELDFHADFCLTAVRAATIYSFVVWFDIEFNHDSGQVKLVHFSTSPDVEQTHWKQSILLLKQPFEIAEGALITGHLSVCKGKENPRELELDLLYSHAGDVSIKQSYKLN
jgi:hypothetical protein